MKPFDLEAAKRGEPIITRDGTPVEFIAHVPNALMLHRVVFLEIGRIATADEQGSHTGDTGSPTAVDLFMAPRKVTLWLNLYADNRAYRHTAFVHGTREEADAAFTEARIGGRAWPIEIEE